MNANEVRTNELNIRIVVPVDLTDEQGETAYYAALDALLGAIRDLTDDEHDAVVSESGFGFDTAQVDA